MLWYFTWYLIGSWISEHNASIFNNKDRNRAGTVDFTLEVPWRKSLFHALYSEKLWYYSNFSSHLLLPYWYTSNILYPSIQLISIFSSFLKKNKEARKDPSKLGLVYLCTFTLLKVFYSILSCCIVLYFSQTIGNLKHIIIYVHMCMFRYLVKGISALLSTVPTTWTYR